MALVSHDYLRHNNLLFSSFYPDVLSYLATDFPNLKLALLWGDYNKENFNLEITLNKLNLSAFHPQISLLDDKTMKTIRSNNIFVNVWTPLLSEEGKQGEILWQKAIDLGVDGFCTNHPDKLIKWLAQNGYKSD